MNSSYSSPIKWLTISNCWTDLHRKRFRKANLSAEIKVQKQVSKVLNIEETRNIVAWHDVEFLKHLEKLYSRNSDIANLAKCSNIIIFDDYISVGWFLFDRVNTYPRTKRGLWIYKQPKSRFSYVDFDTQQKFENKSKRLLTQDDVCFLLENTPWNTIEEVLANFIRIFNFHLWWYYDSIFEKFIWKWKYWKYMLLSNNSRTTCDYFVINSQTVLFVDWWLITDWYFIRYVIK